MRSTLFRRARSTSARRRSCDARRLECVRLGDSHARFTSCRRFAPPRSWLAFVGVENEASARLPSCCGSSSSCDAFGGSPVATAPEWRDGGELRTLEGRKSREVRARAPEFISEFQHERFIVAGQQQRIGHEGFQSLNRQANASKIGRGRLTIALQHSSVENARSYFRDAETNSNHMIL